VISSNAVYSFSPRACLVQRAEAEVAAALDVDRREILAVGRVGEEIPEIVDDVNVEGGVTISGSLPWRPAFRWSIFRH
jgi:hypothetical protein